MLGDRHQSTLTSINNMGSLLQAMDQLEEARLLFAEALQASKETLGDNHPSTLLSINNLAFLLGNQDTLAEAEAKAEAEAEARTKANAAAAAKGLNDNAHGIDRLGYRVRTSATPCPHWWWTPSPTLILPYN